MNFTIDISPLASYGASPNVTNVSNYVLMTHDYDDYAEFDTRDIPYHGELKSAPPGELGVKILLYSVVMTLALVGNGLVMFIVWRNQRMWNTTNYYLVNLAGADYLVTLMCSWVHLVDDLSEGWVLGAFFCKINSFGQVLALVSSILTLTLISCDRFFGIVFAMRAHLTERRSPSLIALVWLCAVAVAAPLLHFREQETRHWANHTEVFCLDTWPIQYTYDDVTGQLIGARHQSRVTYFTVVTVVLFFVPIVVMTSAYTVIIWKLWKARLPGEHVPSGKVAQDKVKRKVAIMLVVLLAIFVVCWLPLVATILYTEYRANPHAELPSWYRHFKFVAVFMAHSNSAINPIIYAGFNDNFKRGFINLFSPKKSRMSQYSSITGTIRRESSFQGTMVTKI